VRAWRLSELQCVGWNKGLHGPAYQSSASGLATPLSQKHRPSHKRSRDANDR